MQRFGKWMAVAVTGTVLTLLSTSTARAACVDLPSLLQKQPRTASSPAARFISNSDPGPIVGMWQFTFTSQGNDVAPFLIPDGAPLDQGYAQWHSDGTEIMNSGRDPATSSFCLGVYEPAGPRTYQLNHFALSWDNTGVLCTPSGGAPSCFVGPTNIRENVTVAKPGNGYSGTVTIDQYDTNGNWMFRLTGTVSADRVTPN